VASAATRGSRRVRAPGPPRAYRPLRAHPERTPVKPAPFTYHRTHDVAETVALLAELGDEAKILAGGQSLVPMMNFRLARPSALIDVTRIPGLDYLRAADDGLHVGALTRHAAVETTRDPAVRAGFAVLPRSARWIGHYPIRARGTFGGSIAHADPAAEWCLLAVLLGARVVLTGPQGQRTVPAAEFFEGYYTTAAGPDEMITELWFPEPAPRAVLTEFAQRQGDFAVVAAAVSADIADGVCRGGRVVLGGVGPLPVEVDTGVMAGQPADPGTWQAMGEHAASQIDPPEDTHGDAGFRRRLTVTLVARALAEASRL
jgi:aerobic carbon-monoxide dehydrogenase medium subunit